jgi:hypothetical protein
MPVKGLRNKNIRIFIHYFLGPLLFILVSYSIYKRLSTQPDLGLSWMHIRESFTSTRILYLVGAILLMIVNWGIEASKWKLCVQKIQEVGFVTAFKAVLSGVSFSVTTPNRVGEYLGRVLYMDDGNRLKAISLTITGSMSQLLITLLMGVAGMVALRPALATIGLFSPFWIDIVFYGTLVALVFLTVFYLRLARVARWIDRLPRIKRYAWLLQTLEEFNATLLLQLLSLSALRFFVFIMQYYLLFRFFDVNVSWEQTLWAISISFLVMAVIPTIALFTDLSLRGEVSLLLLGLFSTNRLGISLTSLSIWVINLIIPALAGSLLILSIKKIFITSKDEERTS